MKALAWIAGIGFALAIVFLGIAFHTAGDSFSFAHQLVGQNPLVVGKDFREWAWSGGDKLTTDVPATITMTPGSRLLSQARSRKNSTINQKIPLAKRAMMKRTMSAEPHVIDRRRHALHRVDRVSLEERPLTVPW